MVGTVRISVFGGFQLGDGTQGRIALRSRRHQALLAWMLLHRDMPTSRSRLAAAFWPETTEDQARTNLRNLIHSLRRAVPGIDTWARLEDPSPHLVDGLVDSDLKEFEEAIHRGTTADAAREWPAARQAYATVVGAYVGDLMPDIDDAWLDPFRDRYRKEAGRALERLAELLEQTRDYAAAIPHARSILERDPLEEEAALRLVRLHMLDGHRGSAGAVWEQFTVLLAEELGVSPELEAVQQVERLLEGPGPEAAPGVGVLPLIGREAEWMRLRAHAMRAMEAHPSLALIVGEAGIGKTRLAEEVVDWARRQGVRVAVARAYAAESDLAYGPAAEWLRSGAFRESLARLDDSRYLEIGRIVPELVAARPGIPAPQPMTEGWERQRLFEAMAHVVLGDGSPLLLLLDDLQWCDGETLEWLHFLLRVDRNARLLLLATWRAGETRQAAMLDDVVHSLERRGALHRIELGPLDQDQTALLAAAATGGDRLSPPHAERLHAETEGSPLFIVEMARAGAGMSFARTTGAEASISPDALPPTVLAAIHSRLVHLSTPAMDAARAAAVIARPFPPEVLSGVMGAGDEAVLDALEELADRRLLRQDEDGVFTYTHDKVRQVVYSTLSPARRRVTHRHVAEALASFHGRHPSASSGVIAMHHERAGAMEEAGAWYLRAAEQARRVFADADAERLYLSAIANLEQVWEDAPSSSGLLDAREGLADTRHRLGRQDQALGDYAELLRHLATGQAVDRARVLRKIARLHRLQRRVEEARARLAEAVAELQAVEKDQTPGWWSAWIDTMLEQVHNAYFDGRVEEIAALLPGFEQAVEEHGTPAQRAEVARSKLQLAFLLDRYTGTEDTVRLARDRHARSVGTGLETAMAATGFALGFTLLQRRDPEARSHLQAALDLARALGDLELQARCLTYLIVDARLHADATRAAMFLDQVETVVDTIGLPEYRAAALANRAWIGRLRGRIQDAETLAGSAVRIWEEGNVYYPFKWLAYAVLLAVAAVSGDAACGQEAARQMLAPSQQRLGDRMVAALDAVIDEGSRDVLVRAVREAEAAGYL